MAMFGFNRPAPEPEMPPAPTSNREALRVKPLSAGDISVRFAAEGAAPIEAGLHDLTVAGAGVSIPFQFDPLLGPDALCQVRFEHRTEGWVVETPARVVHTRQCDDLHVLYGLQFLNAGNLFAQMDAAWSHYFNRRSDRHFLVDLDAPMYARLRQRHHRLDGQVMDVSRSGLCVRVPHAMSSQLQVGVSARLFFDAWDLAGEVELAVTLANRRQLGEHSYLGFQIDEDQPPQCVRGAAALASYVQERQRELERVEAALRGSAA
jgi:hypothetical protein